MLTKELIERKRNGFQLSRDEIDWFVKGMTNGEIGDEQIGAFAMAVFFNGMDNSEKVSFTEAMRDSGEVIEWDLNGLIVNKHSTGGVGDNVSLMLAPALAACGVFVPMISGRGLGHTGGTLDKFDAIPGYNTSPTIQKFKKVVAEVGCAIIGQTNDMAPADKKLYSVRDVTATVESIDLITSSILSKKLAAGLNSLVLDVKVGNGAFMQNHQDARELAQSLVTVANDAGCKTVALITDMSEPLCSSVGNALEVSAAMDFLLGKEVDNRLWEVNCSLGGQLLEQSGKADSFSEGYQMISDAFEKGQAVKKFDEMVRSLGGPEQFSSSYTSDLPKAKFIEEIYHEKCGFVGSVDTKLLGTTLVKLGGGRARSKDVIDYSVGFDWLLGIGNYVSKDQPICRIHGNDAEMVKMAGNNVRTAYELVKDVPSLSGPIIETVK